MSARFYLPRDRVSRRQVKARGFFLGAALPYTAAQEKPRGTVGKGRLSYALLASKQPGMMKRAGLEGPQECGFGRTVAEQFMMKAWMKRIRLSFGGSLSRFAGCFRFAHEAASSLARFSCNLKRSLTVDQTSSAMLCLSFVASTTTQRSGSAFAMARNSSRRVR